MELQQLNYFRKVAKHQSVSTAANELDISEPYLSRKLSLLETELGVKLFDRIGRRIFLNQYGRLFLNCVNSVFDTLEIGIKDLKKYPTCNLEPLASEFLLFLKLSLAARVNL